MRKAREGRWLLLHTACDLLGVNESTLRHWADTGRVRVFRTPGGHRRFAREDIHALVAAGNLSSGSRVKNSWGELALTRIRRKLHSHKDAIQWAGRFDESGRARMRILGRRLLSLTADFLSQRRHRGELLEEARSIGGEHGREMAQQGLSLEEALNASRFFRNSMLDATREFLRHDTSMEAAIRVWQDVTALADEALVGLTRAYAKEKP